MRFGARKRRHKSHPDPATWVLRFVLFGLLAVIIVLLLTLNFGYEDAVGPQQVFETHLLALDEQDWELADTFVVERCQVSGSQAREIAGQDLKSRGFSFVRAFVVDEIWFKDDGQTALLGLLTPPNLPLPGVATMVQVDGEWLVSCS